jgi:hypothetical protein
LPNIFGFYHHPLVTSRVYTFIIALWVFLCLLTSCVESSRNRNRSIELFVFLAPDCPASLYYIPELRKIHTSWGHGVNITGIIPGTAASREECARFSGQHPLPFEVIRDSEMEYVQRWGAEVTPEVVLVDGNGKILYRGAIDDAQPELGTKRSVVQRRYLHETLMALDGQRPLPYKDIPAVGCFIERY